MLRWCKALVLCSVVLLSACSSATFLYNRLDFVLPWYVNDYAQLNRDQEKYLDELLAPFLTWHRAQELPRYIEVVAHIESRLDNTLTPEDIALIFVDFQNAWGRLEGESLEWLLDLGAQLSDEQLEGFFEALWETQQEYEEKYLQRSEKEFYEESYDNMYDNARDYLGRLSSEQKAQIKRGSQKLMRSDSLWLQEQSDWIKRLTVLLAREPGWQQRVRDAVATRNEKFPPDYVKTYEHNLQATYASIAQLLNGRTDKQDKHLRSKLADIRDDLNTLIEQGKDATQTASN